MDKAAVRSCKRNKFLLKDKGFEFNGTIYSSAINALDEYIEKWERLNGKIGMNNDLASKSKSEENISLLINTIERILALLKKHNHFDSNEDIREALISSNKSIKNVLKIFSEDSMRKVEQDKEKIMRERIMSSSTLTLLKIDPNCMSINLKR